jgi:cytochrome b involved in lipid metabolism
MASDIRPPTIKGVAREKVALKPGFHLMDWKRLMDASSDMNCRSGGPPRRIDKAELKRHNTRYDCWTSYNGKVYNISQYMDYHPGGVKVLMAVAGRDCTKQFDKFHAWVNIETMLAKCYVGPLLEENDTIGEEEDDEVAGEEEINGIGTAQEKYRDSEEDKIKTQGDVFSFKQSKGSSKEILNSSDSFNSYTESSLKAAAIASLNEPDSDGI